MSLPNQCRLVQFAVVGESGVGKTSLAFRYSTNHSQRGQAMAEIPFARVLADDTPLRVLLRDTWPAGLPSSLFLLGMDALLLVIDLTDPQSLRALRRWVQHDTVQAMPAKLLIGNKADMMAQRKVSRKEAEQFALTKWSGLFRNVCRRWNGCGCRHGLCNFPCSFKAEEPPIAAASGRACPTFRRLHCAMTCGLLAIEPQDARAGLAQTSGLLPSLTSGTLLPSCTEVLVISSRGCWTLDDVLQPRKVSRWRSRDDSEALMNRLFAQTTYYCCCYSCCSTLFCCSTTRRAATATSSSNSCSSSSSSSSCCCCCCCCSAAETETATATTTAAIGTATLRRCLLVLLLLLLFTIFVFFFTTTTTIATATTTATDELPVIAEAQWFQRGTAPKLQPVGVLA